MSGEQKKLVNLKPEAPVLRENAAYCFPNTIVSDTMRFTRKYGLQCKDQGLPFFYTHHTTRNSK